MTEVRSTAEAILPKKPETKHLEQARFAPSVISRKHRFVQASNRQFPLTVSGPGVNLEFRIPTSSDIDVGATVLRLQGMYGSATAGTAIFANNILSCIKIFRVKIGTEKLWELDMANLWAKIRFAATMDDSQQLGLEPFGIGSRAQRSTWTNAARDYLIPLSAFIDVDVLPLATLGFKLPLVVEIVFETPSNWMEGSGNTPTFTIADAYADYDHVVPADAAKFRDNGFSFFLRNYAHKPTKLLLGDTTPLIKIDMSHSSVSRIISVVRPTAAIDSYTTHDKLDNWVLDNLTSYIVRKDNDSWTPEDRLLGATRIYAEYLRFLKSMAVSDERQSHDWPPQYRTDISFNEFSAQNLTGPYRYINVQDFRNEGGVDIISGVKVDSDHAVEIKFAATGGLSANMTVDSFAEYSVPLVLTNGGGILGLESA